MNRNHCAQIEHVYPSFVSAFRCLAGTLIALASTSALHAQRTFEVNLKPTELIFLNTEIQVGIGNAHRQYGLILGYRPSTQDSGRVRGSGSGLFGGYDQRAFNHLYTAYTLGAYYRSRLGAQSNSFAELNLFYRNWHFDRKPASYDGVEHVGDNFSGTRTEHVNVYCLKLLFGRRYLMHPSIIKETKIYVDLYAGAGIRYQREQYETFGGTVAGNYYAYLKQINHHFLPTPQAGVRIGVIRRRRA